MRDQNHSAVIDTEEVFEPAHGVDVQVVRRLIKQQTVRVQQQEPSQFSPHLPTTRKGSEPLIEIGSFKSQTGENALDVGVHGKTAATCIHVIGIGQPLHKIHVGIGFIVRACLQLMLDLFDLGMQTKHLFERRHGRFAEGLGEVEREILRQQTKAHAVLLGHITTGWCCFTGDDAKECRLPGTITTNKADAVAILNQKVDVLKEDPCSEVDGNIGKGYHNFSTASRITSAQARFDIGGYSVGG